VSKSKTAPVADDGLLSELELPPAPAAEEKKPEAPVNPEPPKVEDKKPEAPVNPEPPKVEAPAKPLTEDQKRIAESRESLKHPAGPNQKFFEAPDGFIIVAESDRDHVPERRPGKPWKVINPRR
jgi:translation initiation factor IF-2